MIVYNRSIKTTDKNYWLIMISCVFTSFIFTVWGGCLLLGCLLYIAFSKRRIKGLLGNYGNSLLPALFKKRGLR
ncbi:hypothetical protein SK3146_02675 [Paenibacillus konkukensis]|uniref:Uncharacterized protein n=1 Tax=Paenibacillus konkukensis TaxID=2020716 RepID=A0ABY4RPJ7_9BACL|nr:hypothetical protein SK3146_02675 [Paenibacillus konkukensis]